MFVSLHRPIYCFNILSSFLLFTFILNGCSAYQNNTYNLDKHIGLYRLTDKKCYQLEGEYNPCKADQYIELVRGHFYGIADSELALVFWRGDLNDPDVKHDLLYSARKMSNHKQVPYSDNKVWLTKEATPNLSESEYFLIHEKNLTEYSYIRKSNGQLMRGIHYKLERVKNDSSIRYMLKYPGDDN